MPLLDHFHPPLSDRRPWEGFHNWWAAQMADALNAAILPENYFADFQIHVGSSVEVDVGAFEKERVAGEAGNGNGGVAVALKAWAPPTARTAMPAVFPDEIEVRVFSASGGATLVAAVELVSPGNKDRPEARRTFAAKCAAYLQRGVGVIVVDIVTSRHANLHDELMALLSHGAGFTFPAPTPLYATAYRPARRQDRNEIDLWREA